MVNRQKKTTGTYEWADATFNAQKGCSNNCVYCYAKRKAPFFRLMPKHGWAIPEPRSEAWMVKKIHEKKIQQARTVMFPSIHDIMPENLALCQTAIQLLLEHCTANLLIVSKPRPDCIAKLIEMQLPQSRVEFRFTIGCWQENTRLDWEQNTPTIDDRLDCVDLARQAGYTVSISMEPLLETDLTVIRDMIDCFTGMELNVWVGAMNYCANPPKLEFDWIHRTFHSNPRVLWKESIRKYFTGQRKLNVWM